MITIPLISRAKKYQNRTAIIAKEGVFSYQQLLQASAAVSTCLLDGKADLEEARVAFLIPPGFDYVAIQWGIWQAGGIAVPLAISHPKPELSYTIKDSEANIVIAHPDFRDKLQLIAKDDGLRFIISTDLLSAKGGDLPEIALERRALIVYTSGTTGKPKGVVTTHKNIQAQVTALISAWGWQQDDHILHILPLHHVHGIVNVLTCALWAGAVCEILPQFNADLVWERFMKSNLTVFMAVPTIYNRLIKTWEAASVETQQAMSAACKKMRLMVSGSAALPVSVLEKWRLISGHTLLERYGMTEMGMALSNPLNGERVPGFVGEPLPNVKIRLVDEAFEPIEVDNTPGQIQVKGPNVFTEYWQKPKETKATFRDGWFCTGDTAIRERGIYRILGRNSVDIIKTGGYKVSALEIEEVLRTHVAIEECAVVGVEDPDWGERICAALLVTAGHNLTLEALRTWTKERLAPYKVPREILIIEALPRNAMGKVTKPKVKQLFKHSGT